MLREWVRMPNDAKLGLVIGVVIVLALGAVYHHHEPSASLMRSRSEAAAVNTASPAGSPYGPRRLTGTSSVEPNDGPGMPESPSDEPAR
jgi:hypothetical protein